MNSKEGFTSVQGFISESGFTSVQGFTNGGGGLGEELQVNWDMSQGLTAWGSSATSSLQAVNDNGEDAVLITQTGASPASGNMSISGLEIGKNYRVRIRARRGVQGDQQRVGSFQWSNNIVTFITESTYQTVTLDVTATATSGLSFLIVAQSGGAVGDEMYVSELSIREIL